MDWSRRWSNWLSLAAGLGLGLAAVPLLPAGAAGDLSKQEPIKVTVMLGDERNALKFIPNIVELETGKLYQLILINPSPQAHYFSSDSMTQAIYTRKVQVLDAGGKTTAEIKGNVREIEVYPKGTTEWWFLPVKAGSFTDLKCTIAGHAEGGMTGTVVVK